MAPVSASMMAPGGTIAFAPGRVLANLAGAQHGVVARRQLLEVGFGASTITLWVKAGHLHTLHRGVYAVGSRAIGEEGLGLAAVLASGPKAGLASISAAEHLRLSHTSGTRPLHVITPRHAKACPAGVCLHRPRRFDPRDLIVVRSVPVTSPTRTIFDAASDVAPGLLQIMVERAEYREELDRVRMRALLAGATKRSGLDVLRELLGLEWIPLSRTRSALERISLSVCRDNALPIPGANVPLLDYEVDLYWPAARFVVEADGGRHVGEQRDRDNQRDVVLARAGILVRRYSWEALQHREAVAREIGEILVERLAAINGPDPDQHAG